METLKGEGPFTVFAPTDEALLKPDVVAGRVMSADVVKMTSAKAVSGDAIAIAVRNGGVMINNAQVVKADIAASNGVIHVIDTVIMPGS